MISTGTKYHAKVEQDYGDTVTAFALCGAAMQDVEEKEVSEEDWEVLGCVKCKAKAKNLK